MEVVIVADAAAQGELVASAVADLIARKPDALFGVATGSTPLPVYQALAAKVAAGQVKWSRLKVCQLDEYVGLPAGHPESYREVLKREVLAPLGIGDSAFLGPDGGAEDLPGACAEYEQQLADAGGVDLQLLGIGTDGHIGFNEPVSSLASRTRIKTLTERTRVDNARFFNGLDEVPRHVITQGIGTILQARHLVLLATGAGKAEAVAATVEGPVVQHGAGLGAATAPARYGGRGRGGGAAAEAHGLLQGDVRFEAGVAGDLTDPARCARRRLLIGKGAVMRRLPGAAHTAQPWLIHEIAGDFLLEDVWELPAPGGGPDDFAVLVSVFDGGLEKDASLPTRALFWLRFKLGAVLRLDRGPPGSGRACRRCGTGCRRRCGSSYGRRQPANKTLISPCSTSAGTSAPWRSPTGRCTGSCTSGGFRTAGADGAGSWRSW